MKKLVFVFLLILFSFPVFSDNVRGPLAGNIEFIPGESEFNPLVINIDDLITIPLEADPYTNGLSIKLKTPRTFQKFRNSYGLYLYKSIYPSPSTSNRYYSGEKVLFEILPMQDEVVIFIPLTTGVTREDKADFYIADPIDPVQGPLVLTINPLMKGLPEEALNIKWTIEGRRYFNNNGGFLADFSEIREDYQNEVTVNINSEIYYNSDKPILLPEGTYTIEATSPYHEPWTKEIEIRAGQITTLSLDPAEKEPTVIFDIPEGTTVIIDGEKIQIQNRNSQLLTEGDHSFFFTLGDHQITKNLYLEGGKEYKISIFLDILVEEAKSIP